jgi:uncharacterized SAM-binding protein YcdF (DUF218 family)
MLLRVLRRLVVLLLGLSALAFVVAFGYVIVRTRGTAELPAECALVFGAAAHPVRDTQRNIIVSTPGPGMYRRVQTAFDLYRAKEIRRVIFTGGRGEGSDLSEAEIMKRLALKQGMKPQDITLEQKSHSTWENLLYSRPLLTSCKSVIGISDGYHLGRIQFLAWLQGWNLPTYPAKDDRSLASEWKSLTREAFGIVYYGAAQTLGIDPLKPVVLTPPD